MTDDDALLKSLPVRRPQRWRGQRFVVDRDQLDARAAELGIAGRIDLHLTRYNNARGTVACLFPLKGQDWRIALDTDLMARDASESLYHELAHVLQAQRLGGVEALRGLRDCEHREAQATMDRRLWRRGLAYDEMPTEAEADDLASRWHAEIPIATRRRD